MKTSETYKKEILEKYKKEKGGEVSIYLAKPTSAQIREACVLLLNKRNSKHDNHILNHFFQFKKEGDKLNEIKNFDADKFRPVVNFLKGRAKKTSTQNIELISWLIDFQPRPLQEYLKSESPIFLGKSKFIGKQENDERVKRVDLKQAKEVETPKKGVTQKSKEFLKENLKVLVALIIVFTLIFSISVLQKNDSVLITENKCMAWVQNHYEEVSCNLTSHKKHGTKIEPYDAKLVANFKKVDVNMATQFFSEVTGKPSIWYTKNKEGEIEYFTSPGLHPITGKTLDEITSYIIQKYVPLHSENVNSFVN